MFILAVTVAAVFVLFIFRNDLKKGYTAAGYRSGPLRARLLPAPPYVRTILSKYFRYYQQLPQQLKSPFEKKVARMIRTKRFIPRNVPEVTIEAKVLIAASAVQLTFGLPDVYLTHFNKILIYPNDYYSSITRRYHKGEVNPRFGIIVLSWQSFIDGYINPSDSFNLGLHEMAHALRLESIIRREDFQFFDAGLLEKMDEYARGYCASPDPDKFLRPYACTNIHEFFSVAIENFFERPSEFRQKLPELYTILAKLLNQDPLLLAKT